MTRTPRLPLLAVLASLLLLPTPSLARGELVEDATIVPEGKWAWAALLGLDVPTATGANVGPRVAGEGLYGFGEIAPKLRLDVGPRIGIAYNGGDASLWTVDAVMVARLEYPITPVLAAYGEAGMGLGFYHWSVNAYGFATSDSGAMLDLLLAPGVIYALTPDVNVLGEVGFWINAKSGLGTHIAIPTLGLQVKL